MRTASHVLVLGAALVLASCTSASGPPQQDAGSFGHFDPKGKPPSASTIARWEELRKTLPLADTADFAEARKGLIATPDFRQVRADDGRVIWDIGRYDFLLDGKPLQSVHPSLQRMAVLNMNYGLFEVVPGIYQVRGFDLANISFVKGKTGWIVIDPLTSTETARAALQFANARLGARPVVAVIYSHTHGDHFGGVRGVVNEADVRSGKVKIIAPRGFMQHAISENVYAGNAMSRRLFMQYGVLLTPNPFGHVDQAIGKNISSGGMSLIPPTVSIDKDFESLTVDGVRMVFQNTPGTEAPAEMNTWFPDFKAFWAAENITGTIHNIYTLRGALVRDALEWSRQVNVALYRFGQDADVMFAAHSWPRWGTKRIQEVMRAQRDAYANLNNAVLNQANQGVTINEIQNVYQVPRALQQQWAARSYHGSEFHNSRAVINRYLGYWDANPATLIPLSPSESAPLYVEMMGGSARIIARGRSLYADGKYRECMEIVNKLVYAEPTNQEGKDLLADCFEQLGYQAESPSVRNSYLAAAYELRHGIPTGDSPTSASPDVVRAMGTDLFLDFLGVRLNPAKAEGKAFTINLVHPDIHERYAVELSNGTLTNIKGYQAPHADLTLSLDRADLEQVMFGKVTLEDLLKGGKAKADGNLGVIAELYAMLDTFELGFEIMPGTSPAPAPAAATTGRPLQQEVPAVRAGE